MCGPCQYAPIKQRWDEVIAEAEVQLTKLDPWAEDFEETEAMVLELREERDRNEWACRRSFPFAPKEVEEKQRVIREIIEGNSPLRKELLPEDIEDMSEVKLQLLYS
jgi:hypothetical protein